VHLNRSSVDVETLWPAIKLALVICLGTERVKKLFGIYAKPKCRGHLKSSSMDWSLSG